MSNNIPAAIKFEPGKLSNLDIQGTLELSALPRLQDALLGGGPVSVQLQGSRDEAGLAQIEGQFSVCAELTCQRCMQPYQAEISSKQCFLPLLSEAQLDKLQGDQEPVLLDDGKINVFSMIEDELLLCLPLIPRHDAADCQIKLESLCPKPSQFGILASLKN